MRTLLPLPAGCIRVEAHPAGMHVLVGLGGGGALLYPIAKGPPRPLTTEWEGAVGNGTMAVTFDAEGRRAIASPWDMSPSIRDPKLRVLRVWDLESGQARTYSLAHLTDDSWWGYYSIRSAADGSLYAAGRGGVSRLRLPIDLRGTVSSEIVYRAWHAMLELSRDGQHLLVSARQNPASDAWEELLVFDVATGRSRRITTHGQHLSGSAAFDATGRFIVTGDADGVVRVGPVTGEEPHLLLGGTTPVEAVAVSPDGRWVGAADALGARLWPMPDTTKPPLHTLPHDELMAKLDALTNLRVVPDPSSATGWKLDVAPFSGWNDLPTW
jgi:WD40 repeat protein